MDDFNTQIMHYREQMEKQKKASAEVISMQMGTMKKHLEDQARGLERREQAEVLRKVKEMIASVSTQADSLQRSFLTISEGLDERFTLFEEYVQARLDAITAQTRGNVTQADISSALEQGLHALKQEFLEFQQNMSLQVGDTKQILEKISCIDTTTAEALPSLVAGWGHGQFPSQKTLLEFMDAKLDEMSSNITTMASLDALGEVQTTIESKVTAIETKLSTCDGMLQFVMRREQEAKSDAVASSLRVDDVRTEIANQIEKTMTHLRSEHEVSSHNQMVMNQRLLDAQEDSKKQQEELKRDLDQVARALVTGARGRQPEDRDGQGMLEGGSEASQRELLAMVAQHSDELARISSRLDGLEPHNQNNSAHIYDEEHISALEEGLQYLNERIVATEKAVQGQPANPQPPARGRPGPRRFSHAEEPGMSQIMSMREEIQRFRGRLVGVEQTLEQFQFSARSVQNAPRDESAYLKTQIDNQLQELYDLVRQGSDDSQYQGSNLLKAVRDSQRTTDLTRSKLEDLSSDFSKLQARFEASVPQLLRSVLELSRRGGGGTGETYCNDFTDNLADDRSSVAGAVSAIQDLLFGCADGSGVHFVSQSKMREAFAVFENGIQSQISKLQQEMIADLDNKADREETSTMSAQLQSAQQRIQVLGQNVFKIISSKDQVEASRPASPLAPESRPLSGLRRNNYQVVSEQGLPLPAIDPGRPR